MTPDPATGVRVDVWTWSVRLYKSRSAATTAAKAGHIRINGARAKPAQTVRIGDEVRATVPDQGGVREHILTVRKLLTKRVAAPLAVAAYNDLTPPPPPREQRPVPVFVRERGSGRPTKRDRRVLDALRASRRASGLDEPGLRS